MVVHVYSCLLSGIIPVQIYTGIITLNGTGIIMNVHEYSSLFLFLEFQESRVLLNQVRADESLIDCMSLYEIQKKKKTLITI